MLTETALLARCNAIEGLSLGQLARRLHWVIPERPIQRKGWAGAALEKVLGADAGNLALPDFTALGIELKTLPINAAGKPTESTFVTSIPLLTIQNQTWETSQCWAKLRRVLWVPVESDPSISFVHRRIGQAILWSPTAAEETILSQDWHELTALIIQGKVDQVDARMGTYLQIRPKAANARALCDAYDEYGQRIQTLPRGFYLRSAFTASSILS